MTTSTACVSYRRRCGNEKGKSGETGEARQCFGSMAKKKEAHGGGEPLTKEQAVVMNATAMSCDLVVLVYHATIACCCTVRKVATMAQLDT